MAASASNPVSRDGYYKGIKLAGKVKIVRNFGDIKIKVVNSFPDIRVKLVDAFPRDIGEWEIVDYGEDFTVEIVNSFPDVRVEFVDSFPASNKLARLMRIFVIEKFVVSGMIGAKKSIRN